MKKAMKFACAIVFVLGMASCSTTMPVVATSNPVGNKCGVAQSTSFLCFGGSSNTGINKAAKNGGITRISHVDYFTKSYLGIINIRGTRVYGE